LYFIELHNSANTFKSKIELFSCYDELFIWSQLLLLMFWHYLIKKLVFINALNILALGWDSWSHMLNCLSQLSLWSILETRSICHLASWLTWQYCSFLGILSYWYMTEKKMLKYSFSQDQSSQKFLRFIF
jgi:glycogen synthase